MDKKHSLDCQEHGLDFCRCAPVLRVSFWTTAGTLFKCGTYKTRKAMRRAQDRYELEYGACLLVRIVEC